MNTSFDIDYYNKNNHINIVNEPPTPHDYDEHIDK